MLKTSGKLLSAASIRRMVLSISIAMICSASFSQSNCAVPGYIGGWHPRAESGLPYVSNIRSPNKTGLIGPVEEVFAGYAASQVGRVYHVGIFQTPVVIESMAIVHRDWGADPELATVRGYDIYTTRRNLNTGALQHLTDYSIYRNSVITYCPNGYQFDGGTCNLVNPNLAQCDEDLKSDKNRDSPDQCVGNPISLNTLTKDQNFIDYESGQQDGLIFQRNYDGPVINGSAVAPGNWSFSYFTRLESSAIDGSWDNTPIVENHLLRAHRLDGEVVHFRIIGGQPVPIDTDTIISLYRAPNGEYWELTDENDNVERYDAAGWLQSITYRSGIEHAITYNHLNDDPADDVISATVTNLASGRAMNLLFDVALASGGVHRIIKVIAPGNLEYRYLYTAEGMLEYVSMPDETPANTGTNQFGEDNPVVRYHYDDAISTALTGITNEEGIRYSLWQYDPLGRVILSEHDPGSDIDRVTVDYQYIDDASDPRIVVTNALGLTETYHFETVLGRRKIIAVDRSAHENPDDSTITCSSANQYITYDSNGYKDHVTDWKGNVIDYDFDLRGLETKRVEGLQWADPARTATMSTPETRMIVTRWHLICGCRHE